MEQKSQIGKEYDNSDMTIYQLIEKEEKVETPLQIKEGQTKKFCNLNIIKENRVSNQRKLNSRDVKGERR